MRIYISLYFIHSNTADFGKSTLPRPAVPAAKRVKTCQTTMSSMKQQREFIAPQWCAAGIGERRFKL
jgi:hypothetical protein